MKINSFDLLKLRNEEHYQFYNEFAGLVDRFSPVKEGLGIDYENFSALLDNEARVLNLIRKSLITDEISLADSTRDTTIDSLFTLVAATTKHFDVNVRNAAAKVQFILKQYKGITHKSYNAETAAVYKLLNELRDKHAAELSAIGADGWINELERNNDTFEKLVKDRYTEAIERPKQKSQVARKQVDSAYRELVKRINALIIVNGAANYEAFVNELNERISKYKLMLAQRKGRNSKVEEEEAQ